MLLPGCLKPGTKQGTLLLPIPPRVLLCSWHSLLWCDGLDLPVSASRGEEVLKEATRAWGWGKKLHGLLRMGWDGSSHYGRQEAG